MPTFSIITPTYNRSHLLERMIQSVLAQTFTDWELIIIDDSTNNETLNYIQKYSDNTKILYQKNESNSGLPYSRNRGLDVATGDWITFLDDDDLFVNDFSLENAHKALAANNAPWVIFNTVNPTGSIRTTVHNKKFSYNWTSDFLFRKDITGDCVHFINKKFLNNIRYSGSHRAEWYFWYKLSEKGNFIHYDAPIVEVEYLEDGMSNQGYLKNEHIYQRQQFFEMITHLK